MVGKTLETARSETSIQPPLRVFVAGGLALRGADGSSIGERAFAGRQGRRLFVRLAAIHAPVAQADLADDLWGSDWPEAWQVSLRALASKLRACLAVVGAASALTSRDGTYALVFPPGTWVDIDAAAEAMHRAEVAVARGEALAEGLGWALAARAISSRPILPGDEAVWLDDLRRDLEDVRLRSLECLAGIWIARGDHALAARDAAEAIAVDPYRESSHRLLIRAHLAADDHAAAARAFVEFRDLLEHELGVSPSPETAALVRVLMR